MNTLPGKIFLKTQSKDRVPKQINWNMQQKLSKRRKLEKKKEKKCKQRLMNYSKEVAEFIRWIKLRRIHYKNKPKNQESDSYQQWIRVFLNMENQIRKLKVI